MTLAEIVLFKECEYCSDARKAAAVLSRLDAQTSKKVTVLSTTFCDDDQHEVRYLEVRCTSCNNTGRIPTADGERLLELLQWDSRRRAAHDQKPAF